MTRIETVTAAPLIAHRGGERPTARRAGDLDLQEAWQLKDEAETEASTGIVRAVEPRAEAWRAPGR
jgi:hypothetical protein